MPRTGEGNPRPRKTPKQARSKATVEAILDAAEMVIAALGEDRLTTNAVAEQAGVSIGTLYQYFSHRDGILLALALRDSDRLAVLVRADERTDEAIRRFVKLVIRVFERRTADSRQATLLAERRVFTGEDDPHPDFVALVQRLWRERGWNGPGFTRERAYVLVRSVVGALRAAEQQDRAMLRTQPFEDALFTLIASMARPGAQEAE